MSTRTKCDYAGCVDGLIPHLKRLIAAGAEMKPDPMDFHLFELCPKCHGAGSVPYAPPKTIPEKA